MIDVVGIIFALLVAAGGIFGYVKAGMKNFFSIQMIFPTNSTNTDFSCLSLQVPYPH